MKMFLLITTLSLSLSLQAQPGLQRSYSTGISSWMTGLLPRTGGSVICGYNNFNYDSTWIQLLFLDSGGQVSLNKTWRTSPVVLSFVNNAVTLNSGYLFCGIGSPNFGDFHPYLVKTDNNGTVNWARWFDNLSFASHQLNAMVPNGNNFTVYSYPDGPTEGFYRIEGDETGSSFSAVAVSNSSFQAAMRIYKAKPLSPVSDHLLIGTGSYVPTDNGADALLVRMNSSYIAWSRLYDFGGHIWDNWTDAAITAGDSVMVIGYGQEDGYPVVHSYIMKLSSDGNMSWCRKLSLDNILEFAGIVETAGGDFIVSALNSGYDGILLKITRNGDLVWARRWAPSVYPLCYFSNIYRDPVTNEIIVAGTFNGSYVVLHLDENGDGCEFEDITAIEMSDFTPDVNDLPLSTASFVPTTQEETLLDRSSTITTEDICQTGIGPVIENEHPVLSPNPAHEVLNISLPASIGQVSVNVFDIAGRRVASFGRVTPGEPVPVSRLEQGLYMVEITGGGKMWREKMVRE